MRVFLDVDGVLADWTGGIHRALGKPYNRKTWPYTKGPGGWHWHDEIGWTFDQVSRLCDFYFWESLHETYDGRCIFNLVRTVGDITLLTTPMPNVMSASGKMKWIKRHYPEFEKHTMITTEAKEILALTPDTILIDDNSNTVNAWREKGGRAVLVPRWWNALHQYTLDAPAMVLHQLEEIPCHES